MSSTSPGALAGGAALGAALTEAAKARSQQRRKTLAPSQVLKQPRHSLMFCRLLSARSIAPALLVATQANECVHVAVVHCSAKPRKQ